MPQKKPSILCVASECFPLIKTGGLADVVGALPLALTQLGVDVTVFLPGFPSVLSGLEKARTLIKLKTFPAPNSRLIKGITQSGLKIIALDAPDLFNFNGNPYQTASGEDRPDNAYKFALFSKTAAELAAGQYGKTKFDVIHAHDWQAGLTSTYLKIIGDRRVKSIFTIHNLAFQGVFPKTILSEIKIPQTFMTSDGLEYWDKVSFLKGGVSFSDRITTVSPTYALEIQSDSDGMGFGGLLRARGNVLSGILNGIDTDVWNPATDPEITASFSAKDFSQKAKNKAALQKKLGLRVAPKAPLFSVVSRLTTQKGLDLLANQVDQITDLGGQLVLLGSGDTAIEAKFKQAALQNPKEISVTIGYDEPFAHQIQASSDAMFIPSRFEPCGLTQLCAMRYGTVPIVGRVGGLSDTIIDANPMALASNVATGLQFSPINTHMLAATINRSFELYSQAKVWKSLVQNCLNQDVSWDRSAQLYLDLYTSVL